MHTVSITDTSIAESKRAEKATDEIQKKGGKMISPSRWLIEFPTIQYRIILLFTILLISSCGSVQLNTTKNAAENQEVGLKNQNRSAPVNDPITPSMKDTILAQVWRKFIQDGKYRLANANDFKIPEWAIKKYRLDPISYAIPFIPTQIGHLAIVVDTTRNDEKRFGLVIFSVDEEAKEGVEQKDTIYWVFQEKDLSKSVIGASRAGVYITGYNEDGTYDDCFVDWDDGQHKYVCQKHLPTK